jgi:putative ABC transport system permease protein
MKPLSYLRQLFFTLFHRADADQDLDEELRSHIARQADDLERSGLSRPEAERKARIAFGSYAKSKESVREQRPGFFLETLAADSRFALRLLRKNPAFTAIAILTLALGIGANTAIFSVVDAVLLRPLPYSQPDRLVTVSECARPHDQATKNEVAPGNFLDWRARNDVFEQIAAVHFPGYSLTGSDRPERVLGAATSAGMLRLLGLQPALGREFEASDDKYGAAPVVLLTDALWKRRYGSDPRIVGKTIHLDTNPYTVVGVLPAGLTFPEPDVQLWVPLEQSIVPREMRWHASHYLDVYARLKPGVTLAQASEEMSRIAAQIKQEQPESNSGAAALVLNLQDDIAGAIRPALLTLLVAVGFVLLIACVNVANLLLVRATSRGKELATRIALGAGKTRLIRQMLTESILLSFAGGCAGLLVASWTRQLLLALRPESLPQFNAIETDGRVLLFTFGVSVFTGLLFGLLPALRSSSINLNPALHAASRSTTPGKSTLRLRNLFVAAEITISLVLLVGAGLTIRSFLRLRDTGLGFRSDHTVTARISIPDDKYSKDGQVISFYDRILERIRNIPGVESAAMVSFLPLTGHNFDNSFDVVGRTPHSPDDRDYALVRFIDPQYFNVLGIPLLNGRGIAEHDRLGSSRAVVLSECMARRYWPNANPIGEHLLVYMGEDQSPWEVVGIVGDVRTSIAEEPQPTLYFPYAQFPYRFMVLTVRTHGDPQSMIETIRNAVLTLDPDEPIYQTRTLDALIDANLVPWRFSMMLLSVFAGIALLLAAAGIYGVMAYLVAQRTHEMGVRMALGAQSRDVLRLVVGDGAKLALIGVGTGLLASLALTRLMSNLLFDVSSTDPLTFGVVALGLSFVAIAACYIPARRATKVDPTIALRCE